MGSSYCTFEEAASRLKRSKRSVHLYVAQGRIRREAVPGGGVHLHRDDVEQLAVELGTDLPALNRKTFFSLIGRVQKLEKDNEVMRRMLGVGHVPLAPSPTEAAGLYRRAADALAAGKWVEEEVRLWASLFPRLGEAVFAAVAEAVSVPSPWAVFLDLCQSMAATLSKSPGYETSLQSQQLAVDLEEGRRSLRSSAVIWIEMGRGTVPPSIASAVDGEKDGLLRRLSVKG